MGRKYHKILFYEKHELQKQKDAMKSLNDYVWKIDNEFGKDWMEKHIWTWCSGITFKKLSKSEFAKVKSLATDLGKLEKQTNRSTIVLKGYAYAGSITIEFTWRLPESCKVEYITDYTRTLDDNEYSIEKGKVILNVIKAEVTCNEPIMKSVFSG